MIRTMQPHDLGTALALSTAAGWNQTVADWQRMLNLEPQGCFVAESGDEVIGTTLCCTFGPVAWLAMVIVRADQRGQGLGRQLVLHGLEYASRCGAVTVRLDATPLGEAVYRQFEFQPQFRLIRMGGVPRESLKVQDYPAPEISVATAADYPQILAHDTLATRTDRTKLLIQLFREWSPLVARIDGQAIQGFLASREGRFAKQLGPCAGSETAAVTLFRHALQSSIGKPVIVDIPSQHLHLLSVADEFGLAEQRTLLRMSRGRIISEDDSRFHFSYGGEFG